MAGGDLGGAGLWLNLQWGQRDAGGQIVWVAEAVAPVWPGVGPLILLLALGM